jgi:hypothetical protein
MGALLLIKKRNHQGGSHGQSQEKEEDSYKSADEFGVH